jgi:hypothetical protein
MNLTLGMNKYQSTGNLDNNLPDICHGDPVFGTRSVVSYICMEIAVAELHVYIIESRSINCVIPINIDDVSVRAGCTQSCHCAHFILEAVPDVLAIARIAYGTENFPRE